MGELKETAPAFPLYPRDLLSSSRVAEMSDAQFGKYIKLLCRQWLDGSIPEDIDRLAKILGASRGEMRKEWVAISPCFEPDAEQPGRLKNPRLEIERAKQRRFMAAQKENGKLGGRPAKQKPTVTHGLREENPNETQTEPNGEPKKSLSFSFSSAVEERPDTAPVSLSGARAQGVSGDEGWSEAWEVSWSAYPKKDDELEAQRTFIETCRQGRLRAKGTPAKIAVRGATFDDLLASIRAWAGSDRWTENGGRFVPTFAKFLERGTFLNPPPGAGSQAGGNSRRTAGSAPAIAPGFNPLATEGDPS